MQAVKPMRKAFTLIEMLAVITILAILAGLVIPKIAGITGQATGAVDANVLSGIDRAMETFEVRFQKYPGAYDGVLASDAAGAFYSKLHPALTTAANPYGTPLLTTLALTATQAQSLSLAGITGIHYQNEAYTGLPSNSGQNYKFLSPGTNVASLARPAFTAHGNEFPDRAFGINIYRPSGATTPPNTNPDHEFVVFALGMGSDLKNNGIMENPVIQAANPEVYYARVLVVFMVPGQDVTTAAKAQYIGCFSPDGKCIQDSLNDYSNNSQPLN